MDRKRQSPRQAPKRNNKKNIYDGYLEDTGFKVFAAAVSEEED
jgi:hypothetical protein